MMKKIVVFLFILLGCTACSFIGDHSDSHEMTEQEREKEFSKVNVKDEDFGYKVTNTYDRKEIKVPKEIKNATDIEEYHDKIYLVSPVDHKVYVCDNEGALITTFGTIGSALGEFSKPQKIAITNEKIYVAEQGNDRIQIFDMDYKPIETIPLGFSTPEFNQIFIDPKENIYISFNSEDPEFQKIFIYQKKNLQAKIGENYVGVFGYDKNTDTIYYAQTLDINNGFKFSGRTFFLELKNGQVKRQVKLPNKIMPNMIDPGESDINIYSDAYLALQKFTPDGKYIETFFELEDIRKDPVGDSVVKKGSNGLYYQLKLDHGEVFQFFPKK